MSKRKRNRPDIQKLRHEVGLLRKEIKTLTERVELTLELNDANLNKFILKAQGLIAGEREKALKVLKTYQTRERTFIRRFLSWFGI